MDFASRASILFALLSGITPDTLLEDPQGFKGKTLKANVRIDNEKKPPPVLKAERAVRVTAGP
jgi:uncharacterized membrane protein